mmetsp:Transcript_12105/g.28692  ORF Transcript_12105/g.28692 Transcript_12105/m.28692 type:complete len:232 (+) Transcript_12105:45-740(+)
MMKKSGKAAAGGRMAAAHRARMEDFQLPGGSCHKSDDSAHCRDCFETSMCQHPYCGTCSFCTGEDFDRDRELLDYQCMCYKCAKAMNRCCGCGKAFGGKPNEVSLPLTHAGRRGGDFLPSPDVEDDVEDQLWEERMEAALELAQEHSGYSKFHDSYPPLFNELWDRYDPGHRGHIMAVEAEAFANDMVARGWSDWKPSKRDTKLWKQLEEKYGSISLEHFAEASENSDFEV